jgi:hypothetical protein
MPRMSLQEKYWEKAAKVYHAQLENAAREKTEAASHVASYLSSHGIPVDTAAQWERIVTRYQLGLVTEPLKGDDRFSGFMSIPYLSDHGPKAIRFRNMGDGKPKIAQHHGQLNRLYNTAAYFRAGDTIGISEGEVDAICATERLGIPTLGLPGADSWTSSRNVWSGIFKNFIRVYVFTDGDKINEKTGLRPGEEMGKAIQEDLGYRCKIIASPEGHDVSSMVASGRASELLAKLEDKEPDDEI